MLLVVAAAGFSRRAAPAESADRPDRPAEDTRRIDMIYMPPPPEPAPFSPPVQPKPPAPPPVVRRTAPEPEPNAPPEATRSTGAESEKDGDGEEAEPPAEPAPTTEAPTEETRTATMESEARRIFGRPRLATRAGAGPQAIRPMEAWLPERPERCIPRPSVPGDSTVPAQLGTVVGRIFRQDNGRPLAGAHLQMIGTPHVAFTDGNGEYRFRFDMALVDNCRTQYVRVSAAGYESRLLVLVIGANRSEDVLLRRR